jgi:hypothetical protein
MGKYQRGNRYIEIQCILDDHDLPIQTARTPTDMVQALEDVFIEGYRHGYTDEWKRETFEHHIQRALNHLDKYRLGLSTEEDDLAHAFCRIGMALMQRGKRS